MCRHQHETSATLFTNHVQVGAQQLHLHSRAGQSLFLWLNSSHLRISLIINTCFKCLPYWLVKQLCISVWSFRLRIPGLLVQLYSPQMSPPRPAMTAEFCLPEMTLQAWIQHYNTQCSTVLREAAVPATEAGPSTVEQLTEGYCLSSFRVALTSLCL